MDVPREMVNLLHVLNLLHEKWLKSEQSIAFLNSVFVSRPDTDNAIVMNQSVLARPIEQVGQLSLIRFKFSFKRHQAPRVAAV